MSDETQEPRLEMVEMPSSDAPRDLETEIKIAWNTIDALKHQMIEMESFNSQLQDTFRLNVGATLLGQFADPYEDNDDEAMARAITLADKFLAYYVEIMQKNAAEYARRITETQPKEALHVVEEHDTPTSESVN